MDDLAAYALLARLGRGKRVLVMHPRRPDAIATILGSRPQSLTVVGATVGQPPPSAGVGLEIVRSLEQLDSSTMRVDVAAAIEGYGELAPDDRTSLHTHASRMLGDRGVFLAWWPHISAEAFALHEAQLAQAFSDVQCFAQLPFVGTTFAPLGPAHDDGQPMPRIELMAQACAEQLQPLAHLALAGPGVRALVAPPVCWWHVTPGPSMTRAKSEVTERVDAQATALERASRLIGELRAELEAAERAQREATPAVPLDPQALLLDLGIEPEAHPQHRTHAASDGGAPRGSDSDRS